MRIKNIIISLGLLPLVLAFAPTANAVALLGQEPAASKIFDAGNGLEWVYAAPCAGESPSCGVVQLHHDFRFATDNEWIDSFTDLAGLIAAFDLTNYDSAICAAPEFSTAHNHCDPNDAISGWVWHAPVGIALDASYAEDSWAETFLVRGRVNDAPEPAGLGLLGLGLLGLGLARKRRG
ncbi:MAG: PEP-CTERM sorting domain-containing protein [Emcibacter sp.]|nr:PEP-CTERM sorting domain-containing protein [Emcibacter sp.]